MITGVHESRVPITEITFSANAELMGDTVVAIPSMASFRAGDHILCYNADGTRKSDVWCIENGYMALPYGYEIVEGELVKTENPVEETPLTLQEYLSQIVQEMKEQVKAEAILEAHAEVAVLTQAVQQEAYVMTQRAKEEVQASVAETQVQTERAFSKMKPLINELLVDKPAAVVLPLVSMMDEWHEGKWTAGKSLTYQGHPYKVVQTHDSTGNPTWTPDATPALFSPWHGVSAETALPWKAPTGAHDMYKVNEYMAFTDGATYRCLQDTAYSPLDFVQAWEMVSE